MSDRVKLGLSGKSNVTDTNETVVMKVPGTWNEKRTFSPSLFWVVIGVVVIIAIITAIVYFKPLSS